MRLWQKILLAQLAAKGQRIFDALRTPIPTGMS
jgi:hypothetical protein